MWKDIVELSKPQITIRRMRIVFWIAKAKNTFSEYVIIIVFPTATIFALKLLNVALFVHYLSCQALINSFLNAIPKSGIKSLYKHSASILHWIVYGIFLNSRNTTCDNQVHRMLTYKLYLIKVDCSI